MPIGLDPCYYVPGVAPDSQILRLGGMWILSMSYDVISDISWLTPIPAHQRLSFEHVMSERYGGQFRIHLKPGQLKQSAAILSGGIDMSKTPAPYLLQEEEGNTTYWVTTNFANYSTRHWVHRNRE